MSALLFSSQDGTQSMRFAPCGREPLSWKQELYAAALSITNRTSRPIYVCASGGMDSEIGCRAFFDQGLNFSVLTVRHAQGTNDHEVRRAVEWCRSHDVPQKIIDMDMPTFLTKEIGTYAETYAAVHPYRYFQIKLMEFVEELGGYAVICGGGHLYYPKSPQGEIKPDDMCLPLSNGHAVPLRWCEGESSMHEPYFHYATPELCLSYLRQPIVDFALKNPDLVFSHPANTRTFKRLVYQSAWPDIQTRYRFDGYEEIRPLYDATLKELHRRFDGQFLRFDPMVSLVEKQLMGSD